MPTLDLFGVKIALEEGTTLPEPDNDNWGVKPDWMTPAELMQWVSRRRAELRRELEADFSLRTCPTHRRHWDAVNAIEAFARWHYYGERE